MSTLPKTICWFGLYDPNFGRNRVYLKGLRAAGVSVLERQDSSPGLRKYWRLWQKHRALGAYDAMVVGYPGHLVVPFARLIARAPVVADLLGSLTDAEEQSHRPGVLRYLKSVLIDRLAVWSANIVLLESEAQKKFFIRKFGASKKYQVLYTGADDTVFWREGDPTERPFTVLFRGRLATESGIFHILAAAALLKDEPRIRFRIIGSGPLLRSVEEYIREQTLSNVELISQHLPDGTLRIKMSEASLALGQLEDNPRLSRTIPHKAFESFALGIPYLSGDTSAMREIAIEGETCFFVPLASPITLADKVLELSHTLELLHLVGAKAKENFTQHFSPRALAESLLGVVISYK